MTIHLSSARTAAASLYDVIVETRRLFHRLTATADEALRDLDVTASQRAVLEALANDGPRTVPHIARAKGVTRQHIQALVNDLLAAELVTTRTNPAHQRSPLVELTGAGRRCFDEIERREHQILTEMAKRFRKRDLAATASTLSAISDHLDND